MKHEEINLQEMFLSVERDFTGGQIPKQQNRYGMSTLLRGLPLLLGIAAIMIPIKDRSAEITESTYQALGRVYMICNDRLIQLMQQLTM